MLELKHLSAGYGKSNVLWDISAHFEKGKLISIIGPNGSGKSTLLKAILGILPTTEGEIWIEGDTSTKLSQNEIAKRIAYLTQGKSVPDMTVGQLVLHGRFPHLSYPRRYSNKDRDIAREAMEKMGVLELAHIPLSELSGGMRQNVYIAMAFAQDTDYILLDEPTTYLDIGHQLALMKILKNLAAEGKGIITVMHDLPMAFTFSDEIVLMEGGRILAQEKPERLSKSSLIESVFGVSVQSVNYQYVY